MANARGPELQRLIGLFEAEANKFPPISFKIHFLGPGLPVSQERFVQPNHALSLWQIYETDGTPETIDKLLVALKQSTKFGIAGAELSCQGVLEGAPTPLFVRMAQRAASLFTPAEAQGINQRLISEIIANLARRPGAKGKPVGIANSNPLAVWLNYLLFYLSQVHPGREHQHTIEPDPFTLSLLALERLAATDSVQKSDRSVTPIEDIKFKVAVSFAGEQRILVSRVVDVLRKELGPNAVFYDFDYQAQLARPNLDILLQRIYQDQCELIVVFLGKDYERKEWPGLEMRVVRDIIKRRDSSRVMPVRVDDVPVSGFLSIDGYIDARQHSPESIAQFILERLKALHLSPR